MVEAAQGFGGTRHGVSTGRGDGYTNAEPLSARGRWHQSQTDEGSVCLHGLGVGLVLSVGGGTTTCIQAKPNSMKYTQIRIVRRSDGPGLGPYLPGLDLHRRQQTLRTRLVVLPPTHPHKHRHCLR